MNNEKVYIIAEAGVNHNGSIQIAKEMVDAAVHAGVDAIKFQTFNPEKAGDRRRAGWKRTHHFTRERNGACDPCNGGG